MTNWTDLTGFRRDILEAISRLERDEGHPPKGLAIKAVLDGWYAEEINHGRLYPNLDHLVDAGLVEKGRIDRRTNSYALTHDARVMLEERVMDLADATGIDVRATVTDGGDRE